MVARPAGAWIETVPSVLIRLALYVAPPAGAWIETYAFILAAREKNVAPPAGAWIETITILEDGVILNSRAPRGRVD